jgi:hypothetical protein
MITNSQKDCVNEKESPAGQDGLAQGDKNHAHILRIADAFVEANDDQPTRRIIRCWCAVTAANEINEAPNNNRYAWQDQCEPNQMRRSQIETRPPSAGDQCQWD